MASCDCTSCRDTEDCAAFIDLNRRVAALLRRIEWNAEREEGDTIGRACPECGGWSAGPELGHRKGCGLTALLKECEA